VGVEPGEHFREESVMQNVAMRVEGNKLVIEVDLTQDLGPSKSGKTTMIATTEGNANVPGHEGVKVGLNVYRARK
jgi:ABC-type polar amino acid transport system ATPase subunit